MINKMDANKHFKDWYFSYDMEKYEGESEEYSAKELIDFAESYYEARTKLKNNGDLGGVVGQSEQLVCKHPLWQRDHYSDNTFKCWECKKIVEN